MTRCSAECKYKFVPYISHSVAVGRRAFIAIIATNGQYKLRNPLQKENYVHVVDLSGPCVLRRDVVGNYKMPTPNDTSRALNFVLQRRSASVLKFHRQFSESSGQVERAQSVCEMGSENLECDGNKR